MEITSTDPPRRLDLDLTFIKPFKSSNTTSFQLAESGQSDQCHVVDGQPGELHDAHRRHLHELREADREATSTRGSPHWRRWPRAERLGADAVGMNVRFEPLWGHAHLAPLLAAWHHAEFGHLYDPRVWNLEIATLELEAMADPGSSDITWIAFDGAIRRRAQRARLGLADRLRRPARIRAPDPMAGEPVRGAPRAWSRARVGAGRPRARRRGEARAPVRAPLHRRAGRLLPRPRVATARRSSSSAVIVRR